jgi:hypothetical protein
VQQDGQLTGHRNNGSFLGVFPAAFTDSQAPLAQGTVRSVAPEHVVSTLDEKFAQITIARFGNAKLWIGVAGLTAPWPEAEITADVPAL